MQTFRKPILTTEGGPQPVIPTDQVRGLNNLELASYLEAGDYDWDGLSETARIAIVRLLRTVEHLCPDKSGDI